MHTNENSMTLNAAGQTAVIYIPEIYSKIMILCDQDTDGSHIKGLCINLFHSEWASLIRIPGFLSFMNTPILRAKKGSQVKVFYNEGEYQSWKDETDTNGWTIKYFKGLGTSTSSEFKEYFANKKVVIFGLPGAFTPTCSSEQLPTFEKMYEQFKAQGVDEVYCVSVNDAFVMNAWAKELGCTNVKLLADGNADFTHAIGMLCNKQHLGFANRSWRYAMYVDNMTVNESFIEEGYNNCGDDQDPYVESTPENVIQYIETLNR